MALTNRQRARILTKQVNTTLRNLRRGERSTTKAVIGTLRKTREEISTLLKGVERFEMPYYRAMLTEIDDKILGFTERMGNSVRGAQGTAFGMGETLTDDILKLTDVISPGFAKLSDELIVASQSTATDLITGMTDDMRKDISRSLRRSILMGENNFQAARKIDKIIGVSKRFGYMNRSDKIARDQIGTAFSIARQEKDLQVSKDIPAMKKQWVSGPNPRHKDMGGGRGFVSHRDADGQIRDVDKPFDVGGEKIMFPRDPIAKPENKINCDCQSVPYMEEWGE